ncbi:MAG TPA: sigma-70 family RNA polymerase sigma factor [Verrucomicrobiae bacterium]|jgi:RNA polymerase sigma factor (sigma-70 family)
MEVFRIHDTRSSLLGRVKNVDDGESWRTFYSIYTKLIHSQALRAGLLESEAEDVVQETMIELSNRLPSFRYDRCAGSFKAWLFQLARWRITNQFRKRDHNVVSIESIVPGEKNAETPALTPASSIQPDESWEKEWQQAVFAAALDSLKRKWPPKQYQAIASLMVHQWSVSQTCKVLGMTRTHLYVTRFRALRQLKKEVTRLKSRTEKGLAW